MHRKLLTLLLIFAFAIIPLAPPRSVVKAAAVTPSDLINLVNSLRTGNSGLPALSTNSILMSTAQWTAETMAANGIHDHLTYHGYPDVRSRIYAAGYGGGATVWATENWAGGYSNMTISFIQSQWADFEHMRPMVGPDYTDIGAGVATDSNGYTIYIVHAAYTSGGSSGSNNSTGSVDTGPSTASQFIEPVFTTTPNADGSIVHIVKYGQSLYTIATFYNVTIEQIKALNNLTSNDIYEGQSLIIRLAPTVTITPTRTPTVMRPTRTPTRTQSPTTPSPILTMTATPSPKLLGSLPKVDRQWFGFGLLIISAVGFFVVLFFSFLKPLRKK